MKNVIIFGTQDLAELAHYYLTHDSDYNVVAFSVSKEFMDSGEFLGLPIVPFESVEIDYPPSEYMFFAPMTHSKMNKVREEVYYKIKDKGYKFISYISSKAYISNNNIGDNCFILEDNTLQPFTDIGNNVILWSGNHIGHHGEIKDHVFITSHVVISGHCSIESYAFIGVNATIRDGITIGQGSLIAMGAMVTKSTDPWGVYMGSPAKKGLKNSNEI